MNIQFDFSLNTLVISVVVGAVGYAVKKAVEVICNTLIEKLIENAATNAITDEKINQLIDKTGDVEKLRRDLNQYFDFYREMKNEVAGLKKLIRERNK